MTLLALCGYARVGKDTVADFLVREHGFTKVSFATPLKAILHDLNPVVSPNPSETGVQRLATLISAFGWDGAKTVPEVRRLLQRLGVAVREHIDPDLWVHRAMEDVTDRCVISDTRFANEVAAMKDQGGCLVRVVRPGVTAVNEHVSETAIDDIVEDFRLINDGTIDDLYHAAEEMMEWLNIL